MGIQRKRVLDKRGIVLLVRRIGAERIAPLHRGKIDTIDPHLHRARLGHRHLQAAEDRAAKDLVVGKLRVQIDPALVLPRLVPHKIDVIIVRDRGAAAVPAIADSDQVTELSRNSAGKDAICGDPCPVHVGIAVGCGAVVAQVL